MKFEKLNENKIRITLTVQDLIEKDIDFHAFMADSTKAQDILLDMLEEAKKETGFDPADNNLKVEALVMADSNFIFTITKLPLEVKSKNNKKFTVKRKNAAISSTHAVYLFNCFDDFNDFLIFLYKTVSESNVKKLAKSIVLYEYKDKYYLILNGINVELVKQIRLYSCVTEFAKCVANSKLFASKLKECGNLIMKNNALEIGFKHFVSL